MAELSVLVVTFRDIFQSEAQEAGRYGEEYRKASALILLDRGDADRAGIKDGSAVTIASDAGSVVVNAGVDQESHPGVAFMPNSPWSNQLVSGQVGPSKIPEFKRIEARLSSASGPVLKIEELLLGIVQG